MMIEPAGTFDASVVQFGNRAKAAKWCKTCGRKHPRNADCDLVEYQQGGTYEKMVFDEEAGRDKLKTLRHPGRSMHRQSYEARKAQDGNGD